VGIDRVKGMLYVTRPTNKRLALVWDWAVSEFGLLQWMRLDGRMWTFQGKRKALAYMDCQVENNVSFWRKRQEEPSGRFVEDYSSASSWACRILKQLEKTGHVQRVVGHHQSGGPTGRVPESLKEREGRQ
jgi:hypothetical protein